MLHENRRSRRQRNQTATPHFIRTEKGGKSARTPLQAAGENEDAQTPAASCCRCAKKGENAASPQQT